MTSVPYVGLNLLKNLMVPVATRVLGDRRRFGMDGDLDLVLGGLQRMSGALGSGGVQVDGACVLELGPGRTPEMGAAFVLAGARRAVLLDTSVRVAGPVANADRYTALSARLSERDGVGSGFLPALGADARRVRERLATLAETGMPLSVEAYDGRNIPLPDGSVDLAVSTSVLEHVRPADVDPLLAELSRVLRPGGAMVHVIDLRDHMRIDDHDDVEGDWLDALRYPEPLFRAMFSRRGTAINRLREPQWHERFTRAGFSVEHWELQRFPLAQTFRREQLQEPWRSYPRQTLEVGWISAALRRESAR